METILEDPNRFKEENNFMGTGLICLSSTMTTEESKKFREQTKITLDPEDPCLKQLIDEAVDKKVDIKIKELIKKQKPQEIVRVIQIKEQTYQKCKDDINDLIHNSKKAITTLEITEELGIEPEVVLKALTELKEEGKIGKAD